MRPDNGHISPGGSGCDPPTTKGAHVLTIVLFLILAWVILGIIGFVIKGLFWLFVIACILFLITLVGSGFSHGRRGRVRAR